MSTSAKSSSSSFSAEIIGYNNGLLIEILKYIPTKPLLRFKLVSKQWNSVISHPSFFALHRYHHFPLPSGIFFLRYLKSLSSIYNFVSFTSNSQNNSPLYMDILHSCNGLLLCSSGYNVYVCNPTTSQLFQVDLGFNTIDEDGEDGPFDGLFLGFDPIKSLHYQIIGVLETKFEGVFSIDVYSSSTKQWRRRVIDYFKAQFDVEFDHGVYWEGWILWLSHTDSTIYFDVEKECVETLMLPKSIDESYRKRFTYFGESCGHLHLIEIRTFEQLEFDVLELNIENKIEWFVKYRVNLDVLGPRIGTEVFYDQISGGYRLPGFQFSIFAVIRGKEEDKYNSELILSIRGEVIAYNFRTKVSRTLCNIQKNGSDRKLFLDTRYNNAFQFIESLYSLPI